MISELHPLEPFLPVGARLLMLGSFPPQRVRWSMDFFTRICRTICGVSSDWYFRGQGVFSDTRREAFRQGTDRAFLRGERIGSLRYGRRDNPIENNASDNFLQVVREVDLAQLLAAVPTCRAIVTTGQKATDVIVRLAGCAEPPVGESVEFAYADRTLRLYRMPSSSRAYPKPVEWKADYYRRMFAACGML